MLFAYLLLMFVLIYFMSFIAFIVVSALKATTNNKNAVVAPVVDNNTKEVQKAKEKTEEIVKFIETVKKIKENKISEPSTRSKRIIYTTDKKVAVVYDIVRNGISVKNAAKKHGISVTSAYNWKHVITNAQLQEHEAELSEQAEKLATTLAPAEINTNTNVDVDTNVNANADMNIDIDIKAITCYAFLKLLVLAVSFFAGVFSFTKKSFDKVNNIFNKIKTVNNTNIKKYVYCSILSLLLMTAVYGDVFNKYNSIVGKIKMVLKFDDISIKRITHYFFLMPLLLIAGAFASAFKFAENLYNSKWYAVIHAKAAIVKERIIASISNCRDIVISTKQYVTGFIHTMLSIYHYTGLGNIKLLASIVVICISISCNAISVNRFVCILARTGGGYFIIKKYCFKTDTILGANIRSLLMTTLFTDCVAAIVWLFNITIIYSLQLYIMWGAKHHGRNGGLNFMSAKSITIFNTS